MSIGNEQFSKEDLQKINDADDLHIAPLREDGKTYGTPTWIWAVIVEGDLYVRAYHGTNSRWYQAAMIQKLGRINAAGMVKEVRFEPVDGDINNLIDDAYKKKYNGSTYLPPMVSERTRAATVKIIPNEDYKTVDV